ncbi:MAG: ABC transporter permease [Sandaracinaceae bacterium]|jgi:putative ABC transport system permease protein|nr:ABC transporter permease [Sandaracinaceae bacterium]
MFEHLRSALQSLTSNKTRAGLTMLGVIIGVLAVVLLVSVGDGARVYLDSTLSSIGTNLLFVTPGRRETRGGFSHPQSGSAKPLTMDDVHALERQTHLLTSVCPIVEGGGAVRYGGRTRDTMVAGVGESFGVLRSMTINIGTHISSEDVDARRRVAVLGRTVVRELFGNENPLGKAIRVANGRFRVIGVLEPKGSTFGADMDDLVLIPATSAEDLFGQEFLTSILTAVRSREDAAPAMEEIEQTLARRRHGERTFTVMSQDDLMNVFGSLTSAMTLALLAIASVSLIVGGIGIMNIMFVSVRERTREIGLRRALGATRGDVLLQFLVESLVLSSTGGLIGLAIGVVVIAGVNRYFPDVPLRLSAWIAAVAFGAAFVVGVVSGVVPARRAARLDPVEALRYE